MNLSQLETFLAVARRGNFHAAARQLHVTQAAVSARVKQLEEILDVRLFERGRRGATLTEAGKFLLSGAESIVNTWTAISKDARQRYSDRILLRLGGQLSIWDQQLIDLVIWVEENLGKLPLSLNFDHEIDVQDAVRRGVLDVAVTHERPNADLVSVALPPERLILVGTQPCALGDGALPLFINFQFGERYDAFVARHLHGHAAQHIMMGNCGMGLQYLRQRGGIALFPKAMVAEDLSQGSLYRIAGLPEMELPCNVVSHPASVLGAMTTSIVEGLRTLRTGVATGPEMSPHSSLP